MMRIQGDAPFVQKTPLPKKPRRPGESNDIVAQYWSVLTRGREILPWLPGGWRESIDYLSDVISTHRVEREWRNRPADVRIALNSLIRNGGPAMFIAEQALRGSEGARNRLCFGRMGKVVYSDGR